MSNPLYTNTLGVARWAVGVRATDGREYYLLECDTYLAPVPEDCEILGLIPIYNGWS
jgi:hypothetical protein